MKINDAENEMKELNDFDLAAITGGLLTPEAEEWIDRNMETVKNRANIFLRGFVNTAVDFVKNDSTLYDIDGLKALLKEKAGIDAYDLD